MRLKTYGENEVDDNQ